MDNPFLKRATELYRDEEAFLAVVSPEPVSNFLGNSGKDGRLYDRLVLLQGTPGSGKTTIARLFEYRTVASLQKNTQSDYYKTLAASLDKCGLLTDGEPSIVGCRLPLESDYREIWEFPYNESLRTGLTTALIQCRAVLSWFRNLSDGGIDETQVELIVKEGSVGGIEAIGGTDGCEVLQRARDVEASLYKIVAALVPPDESSLDNNTTEAYRPFDVVERFRIIDTAGDPRDLQPLVILDDAHTLHPTQYKNIEHWMARRELSVARWILTRLDVMRPEEVFEASKTSVDPHVELPGIISKRDTLPINLQGKDRKKSRIAFRKLGRDISARYLRKMSIFASRELSSLADLLSDCDISISLTDRKKLTREIDSKQKKLSLSDGVRQKLDERITNYRQDLPEDLHLAILSIMLHRHSGRLSGDQKSLFPDEEIEPTKPVVPKLEMIDAARLHLYHKFGRPFYYGIEALCDASSENVEQFLRLASALVNASATNLVRGKPPTLDVRNQTKLLVQRATQAISDWDYPYCKSVQRLTGQIAVLCEQKSLEGNAPLGAGANAYAILQSDFDKLSRTKPDLARILQFAISYSAISLVPNYECKNKLWCVMELGGMVILKHGLTLKRGGFIEGDVDQLEAFLSLGES